MPKYVCIYVCILRYPKWVNNYVTMFMMTTLYMNIQSHQKYKMKFIDGVMIDIA